MHFPHIHPRPTKGWLNDPNGIMYYDGRYHLMFQHNPFSARHDRIHWGHFSSPDLLGWREESLAVVPMDGFDPLGAWSGVGAVIDGEPTVVYSGVSTKFGESDVVIARSQPVGEPGFAQSSIAAPMPTEPVLHGNEYLTITEIRDPFVFSHKGRRLAIQGCGFSDNRAGIVLYDATDLDAWRLIGPLLVNSDLPEGLAAEVEANIFECPQLFRVGDQWVLMVSLWRRIDAGHGALSGVGYLVGNLVPGEGEGLRFAPMSAGRLDAGPDFYAPQVVPFGPTALAGNPGIERNLLWGWSWENAARTDAETDAQEWAGILTLPREIVARAGSKPGIVALPARELVNLRVDAGVEETQVRLTGASEIVASTGTSIKVTAGGKSLRFEAADGGLRAFIDGSILEVFSAAIVAGGTHTERFYPEGGNWLVEASAPVRVFNLAVRRSSEETTNNG